MTEQDALVAAHGAVLASGAGNVILARFKSSARVTWRRQDARGEYAELEWRPSRDEVAHVLIAFSEGQTRAFSVHAS